MEFFRPFTFLVILGESIALLPRNAKFFAFIAISSLLLHSTLAFFFTRSVHQLLRNKFQTALPDPNALLDIPDLQPFSASTAPAAAITVPKIGLDLSHFASPFLHLRQDLATLLAVELAFVLAFSVVSFFSTISTIVVAAMSYKFRTLSFRGFVAGIWRTWARFLVTCFYVSSLTVGYFALVITFSSPLLVYLNFNTIAIIAICSIALLFFLYLSVSFALSLVITIIEENCYGVQAVGKASGLIKGVRVHGFFLNVCFNLVVLGIFQICQLSTSHRKGLLIHTISEIASTDACFLVKMFLDIAYTALYFHCKKDHGEEIELYGCLQYSKLPTTMLGGDDEDDEDLP